jgi:hypothetical protein
MASIYIKKPDGTFERVGDTQGLMIPQTARYCRIQITNGQTITTNPVAVSFNPSTLQGENLMDSTNTKFVAPIAGLYIFNLADVSSTAAGNTNYKRVGVVRYDKNNTLIEQVDYTLNAYQGTRNYYWSDGAVTWMNEGDYLSLQFSNSAGNLTLDTTYGNNKGYATFGLIEQQVPYLVANKGALVSGGAFQFDIDGNGYTKNYFPVGVEVRVGTHYNGKPIYQRTVVREQNVAFANANVDAWRTNIFGSTTYIDEIVDQNNTLKLSDTGKNWLSSGTNYNNGSGDWTCVIMYRQATDCLAIEKRVAITADVTITFWYTKTTD